MCDTLWDVSLTQAITISRIILERDVLCDLHRGDIYVIMPISILRVIKTTRTIAAITRITIT